MVKSPVAPTTSFSRGDANMAATSMTGCRPNVSYEAHRVQRRDERESLRAKYLERPRLRGAAELNRRTNRSRYLIRKSKLMPNGPVRVRRLAVRMAIRLARVLPEIFQPTKTRVRMS